MEIGASGACRIAARLHPGFVAPAVIVRLRNDRSRAGRRFGLARERIGLPRHLHPARTDDVVFVTRSRRHAGNEQLPDPGAVAHAHRVPAAIPGIEIADDRHARGIRRPDGEAYAGDAVDRNDLGAEAVRQVEVPPLVEQMKIQLAEQQSEGIRVFGLLNGIRPDDPQPIRYAFMNEVFEQTGLVRGLERRQHRAIGLAHDIDFGRAGQKGANDPSLAGIVRAEHGKRVVVSAEGERARGLLIEPPGWFEPCLSHDGLRRPCR